MENKNNTKLSLQPAVRQNLVRGRSFAPLDPEYARQELLAPHRNHWLPVLPSLDVPVQLHVVLPSERECPRYHGVQDNSETPDVDWFSVVLVLADDFWCHVGGGSAVVVELGVVLDDDAEAEVDELDVALVGEEDVLELDVAVDDVVLVAVVDALDDFAEDGARLVFADPPAGLLLEVLPEADLAAVLHDEVVLGLRVDGVEQSDHVGVLHLLEDVHLPPQVLPLLRVAQPRLRVRLDRHLLLRQLVPRLLHRRVRPSPQRVLKRVPEDPLAGVHLRLPLHPHLVPHRSHRPRVDPRRVRPLYQVQVHLLRSRPSLLLHLHLLLLMVLLLKQRIHHVLQLILRTISLLLLLVKHSLRVEYLLTNSRLRPLLLIQVARQRLAYVIIQNLLLIDSIKKATTIYLLYALLVLLGFRDFGGFLSDVCVEVQQVLLLLIGLQSPQDLHRLLPLHAHAPSFYR